MLVDRVHTTNRASFSTHFTGSGSWTKTCMGHTFTNKSAAAYLQIEVPLEPIDLYYYLGFSASYRDAGGATQNTYYALAPPSRDLSRLYGSAYYRWSHMLHTAWTFFRGRWKFIRAHQNVPNENPVLHQNVVGSTESGLIDTFLLRDYLDEDGEYETESKYHKSVTLGLDESLPELSLNESTFSSPLKGTIHGRLVSIQNDIDNGVYDSDGANNKNWAYYPRIVITSSTAYIQYLWILGDRESKSAGWRWYALSCIYKVGLTVNLLSPDPGDTVHTDDLYTRDGSVGDRVLFGPVYAYSYGSNPTKQGVYSYFGMSAYEGDDPSQSESFRSINRYPASVYFTHDPNPSRVKELIGFSGDSYRRTSHSKDLQRFSSVFSSMFPNFASGAFLSTQDALDTHLGGLSGNYIETASEAHDILRPLDLIKGARVFLSRNYKGGLFKFLLFLANANLAYKFGIAPTISDAKDVRRNLVPFVEKLKSGNLFRPTTIYGQKDFDALDTLDEHFVVNVRVRSKIRLRSNEDSILPYILPLDSLGLLPSMSRLWDTIPYSWLIDKAFDLGGSMELIEKQAFQLALNVAFSTHTVRVEYPFSVEDQEEYHFGISSGTDLTGYRLFVRYAILHGLPSLGPTVLPIFRPSSLPSWDILGSILVKRY